MLKEKLNETNDNEEKIEKTPVVRRQDSDIQNSDFNLMNQKLLELNLVEIHEDNNSPQLKSQSMEPENYINTINENGEEKETVFTRDLKFIQRMLYYFQFFSEFILRDFKIKPLNNVISVSTIVLLIIFLGLINVLMSLSPMIYLMMSEQEVGESDVIIYNQTTLQPYYSDPVITDLFVDYKSVNNLYCEKHLKGCTARYHFKGMLAINNQDIFSDVLFIDVMKEEKIGLGRRVQLKELKQNECYVSRNLLTLLKKGDTPKGKKPKLVLEMTVGLLLSSFPRLYYENAAQSYSVKRQFIANLLEQKFTKDQVRYNSVSDIILHYLPEGALEQQYRDQISSFDFIGFLGRPSESYQGNDKNVLCQRIAVFLLDFKFSLNLEVKDVVENSTGKFEDKISNLILLDYLAQFDYIISQVTESFVSHVTNRMGYFSIAYYAYLNVQRQHINSQLLSLARSKLDSSLLQQHAIILYGIYKNKQNVYLDESKITDEIQAKSNQFTDSFGFDSSLTILFPLSLTQILNLKQKQILDNSYNCCVILLIALSSVIIYSVSQSSIQQKVQEYGVVRIIGYSTQSLIIFSLLKAIIFYMIPALLLAEGLNVIILVFIKNYFYGLLQFSTDLTQEYSNSYYATTLLLGIGLPLFCNLYPFKQFFERQVLSQALNMHQRVLQQTKVIFQKLEKYGISFYALVNSLILIFVGIIAYYFAPYAFVTKQIGLFLLIVNLTFLMVNVGISCLINIVQRRLEIAWIHCIFKIFCRNDRNLEPSVKNNFNNNNLRMQKLGMIIMMIFSFYISIGSSVNSQIMMVQNMVKINIGSDCLLEVEDQNTSLDEHKLKLNLELYKQKQPNVIKSYTFVSKNIKSMAGFQKGGRIRNYIGGNANWDFIAISPNFFDSIYSDLFVPDSPLYPGQNPSNTLYYSNGTSVGGFREDETLLSKDHYKVFAQITNPSYIQYISLVEHPQEQYLHLYISSKDKKALSLDYDYHMDFIMGATRFKARPMGFAKKIPGFKSFTENSIFSFFEDNQVFISYEQLAHIFQTGWQIQGFSPVQQDFFLDQYQQNLSFKIPKNQLFIKFNDDVEITQQQRNMLKSYLMENQNENSVHQDAQLVTLYETYSILESLNYLITFWSLLFNLISLFIFILTYYLLTITFKQNVNENLHNIKIYKSIGLSHKQVQKIFIYEGVTVMIINGVIGLLVGMILSIMIQQQLIVFLEIPFNMSQIPYKISSLLLVTCILLAIYTSKSEIDQVKNKQISEIDR